MSENIDLRRLFSYFNSWVRMQSVMMQAEKSPKMEWSLNSLNGFKQIQGMDDALNDSHFLKDILDKALKEWEGSDQKKAMCAALSRCISLTEPNDKGGEDLYHPIYKQVLRSDGLNNSIKLFKGNEKVLSKENNKDFAQNLSLSWVPNDSSNPVIFHAHSKETIEHSRFQGVLKQGLIRVLGPELSFVTNRWESQVFKDKAVNDARSPSADLYTLINHFGFIRLAAMALPEEQSVLKKMLEDAVGSESSEGWLKKSLEAKFLKDGEELWDELKAKELNAVAEASFLKIKNALHSLETEVEIPTAIDFALASLSPLLNSGSFDINELKKYNKTLSDACYKKLREEDILINFDSEKLSKKAYLNLINLGIEVIGIKSQDTSRSIYRELMLSSHQKELLNELSDLSNAHQRLWLGLAVPMVFSASEANVEDIEETTKNKKQVIRLLDEAQRFMLTAGGNLDDIVDENILNRVKAISCSHLKAKNVDSVDDVASEFLDNLFEGVSSLTQEMALAREVFWLKINGLKKSSKRLEEGEFVSLNDLQNETHLVAMEKMSSPEGRLWVTLDAAWASSRALSRDSTRKTLAFLGLGTKELTEFAKTSHCEAFFKVLHCGASSFQIKNRLQKTLALLLAFEADSKNPEKRGGWSDINEERIQKLAEVALGNNEYSEKLSEWVSRQMTAANQSSLSYVFAAENLLGEGNGVIWATQRANEMRVQAGSAMRCVLNQACGRDVEGENPVLSGINSWASQNLGINMLDEDFFRALSGIEDLPYGFDGDLSFKKALIIHGYKSGNFGEEVNQMLKTEGFAGEMAFCAGMAGRVPVFRENVNERSKANAWLALGKQVAKEWFNVTDSGYHLLLESNSESQKDFLNIALEKAKEEVSRLNISLREDSDSTVLGYMLNLAGAKGLSVEDVIIADRGVKAWNLARLNRSSEARYWGNVVIEKLIDGMSLKNILEDLNKEIQLEKASKERLGSELLDRASYLRKNTPATKKKSVKEVCIRKIEEELKDMADWANDRAGRLWVNLPKKWSFSHLKNESDRWHEDQIENNQVDVGADWDPVNVNWSDTVNDVKLVELTTSAALVAEGRAMRHCVGSYASVCRKGTSRIFSILKDGARLATLELEPPARAYNSIQEKLVPIKGDWRIKQLKEVCNKAPSDFTIEVAKSIKKAIEDHWSFIVNEENEIKEKKRILLIEKENEKAKNLEAKGFDPLAVSLRKRVKMKF